MPMTTQDEHAHSAAVPRTTQDDPFMPLCTAADAQRILHVWQPTWGTLGRLTDQRVLGHQPKRAELTKAALAEQHQRRWPQSCAGRALAVQAVRLFGPPEWITPPLWVIRIDHPNVAGWVTVQAWTGWAALAVLRASMPECLDAEAHPDPSTDYGRRMAEALELWP